MEQNVITDPDITQLGSLALALEDRLVTFVCYHFLQVTGTCNHACCPCKPFLSVKTLVESSSSDERATESPSCKLGNEMPKRVKFTKLLWWELEFDELEVS